MRRNLPARHQLAKGAFRKPRVRDGLPGCEPRARVRRALGQQLRDVRREMFSDPPCKLARKNWPHLVRSVCLAAIHYRSQFVEELGEPRRMGMGLISQSVEVVSVSTSGARGQSREGWGCGGGRGRCGRRPTGRTSRSSMTTATCRRASSCAQPCCQAWSPGTAIAAMSREQAAIMSGGPSTRTIRFRASAAGCGIRPRRLPGAASILGWPVLLGW